MENPARFFPRYGNISSTLWKTPAEFSTLWKHFFHTVENESVSPHLEEPPPRAPILMGILNLTPDSFSDGGRFLDPTADIDQVRSVGFQSQGLIQGGGGIEKTPGPVTNSYLLPKNSGA